MLPSPGLEGKATTQEFQELDSLGWLWRPYPEETPLRVWEIFWVKHRSPLDSISTLLGLEDGGPVMWSRLIWFAWLSFLATFSILILINNTISINNICYLLRISIIYQVYNLHLIITETLQGRFINPWTNWSPKRLGDVGSHSKWQSQDLKVCLFDSKVFTSQVRGLFHPCQHKPLTWVLQRSSLLKSNLGGAAFPSKSLLRLGGYYDPSLRSLSLNGIWVVRRSDWEHHFCQWFECGK